MFSKRSTECKITDDAQMLDEERIPIAIGHMSDSVFLIKNVMGAFLRKKNSDNLLLQYSTKSNKLF